MAGKSSWQVLKQTVAQFGQETSISGINNAGKGKSKLRSGIWLAIFAILGYYTVDGIWEIVLDYYAYPIITNTDLTYKAEVDFPAVTICNLNRVNCHNAFHAMYEVDSQVNSASTSEELTSLNTSLLMYNLLLSPTVSDCLTPMCNTLKEFVCFTSY
jgi:hypothetical protein